MIRLHRPLLRALGAFLLAVALPACGTATPSQMTPSTPTITLFTETWDSGINPGIAGSAWTPTIPLGMGVVDTITDPTNPRLGLFSTSGSGTVSITTIPAVNSFLVSPSITISVLMSVSGQDACVGTFEIQSSSTTAMASWDANTQIITFSFGAVKIPVGPVAAGTLHMLAFTVNSSGVVGWFIDGALITTAVWPAGPVSITLGGTFSHAGTPSPQFTFDDIVATNP